MLDRLIDFVVQFIELFHIWKIVDEWESGIVLRFGRYHRDVGPGWHWVWPLAIERVVTEDTYKRPTALQAQSLTTADDVGAVLTPVVTWKITNARKVILESGGHEMALMDSVAGVLAEQVSGMKWADLTGEEFRKTVVSEVRKRARTWGIKVFDVQLRDVTKAPTLRLLQAQRFED